MARSMYASVLPSIKCSDCGVDIEISLMGDHICTGDPGLSDTSTTRTSHDRIPGSAFPPPFASPASPSESLINAERFFARKDVTAQRPISPSLSNTLQRPGTAEVPVATSHFETQDAPRFAQSQTSSQFHSPKRSATDPIPTIVRPPSEDLKLPQDSAFPMFPSKRVLSRPGAPAALGLDGASVSKRDDLRDIAPLSPSITGGAHVLKRMHTITPGPFGARSRKVEASATPAHAASREYGSSNPIGASIPAGAPPSRPPRPETDDSLLEKLQGLSYLPPQLETTQESLHVPEDGISAGGDLVAQGKDSASDPEPLTPLPDFSPLHSTTNRQTGHASTSSESSAGSRSGFGSRTESSRSSHSSPISPHESGNFHQTILPIDQISPNSERSRQALAPRQITGIFYKDAMVLSSPAVNSTFPETDRRPSTTVDEAISAPLPDPAGVQVEAGKGEPPQEDSRAMPKLLDKAPRVLKSKGMCRGCEKPIFGKSIKAADGRLTGRYHRDCFLCHTCQQSFETAEFYVHNNHPYCAHHYHVANNSLCHLCKRGIEGKYLETVPSQKYHLDCFACHDCRKPLTSDYYALNHLFYCKADAYRVYEKSRLLSPGKRFPERRMTRLMVM